jgi:hypothetical protein
LAALPVVAGWTRRRFGVMLTVLIVQLLVCGYFLRPVGTGIPFYTPRPVETTIPPMTQSLDAHFGPDNGPVLLGYDLDTNQAHPGDSLRLTLYWQTQQRLQYPYTVFVQVLDAAGQIRAQDDSMPQAGNLPTTCWQENEVVPDEHTLSLDPALLPGSYSISAGLYRLDLLAAGDPNHRLPVRRAGQIGDHVDLTPIQIEQP